MCNSSSSVLVLNRTSPSVQHTSVVDTLLNFLLPFNIPVILAYINSSRVNAFERILVKSKFLDSSCNPFGNERLNKSSKR